MIFTKRPLLTLCAILYMNSLAWAGQPQAPAGEVFGQPITEEEFNFVVKTRTIFSTAEKEPQTDQERRSEAWKHVIFLREADRRGIQVTPAEVEKELTRLLAEKNITYGTPLYRQFIQQSFQEEPAVFESRIRDLLKVKKLIDGIMNPPPPTITDADAKQKFLNQYNSMATEFVNFPTLDEAKDFFKRTPPQKWDEAKTKNSKFSTPTGHISLEALIDLWQVPTDDAYRIHRMKIGQIAAPAKMYKGYGVFRLKEKKESNLQDYTDKKRDEYKKILEQVYYYNHSQKILKDIIVNANMRDYERDKILTVQTTQGTFEVYLWTEVAPKACDNIMQLSEKGYFNGTIFHRVIPGFMIQGGDPTGTGTGGQSIWGEDFKDEVRSEIQFDRRGLLAMANRGPHTNGSQFFITVAPVPHLNMKHTILGEVIQGYEVIQKIAQTPTDKNDRPLTEQKILRMGVKKWA